MNIIRTISLLLILLMIIALAFFTFSKIGGIEEDLSDASRAIKKFEDFIDILRKEMENRGIFNKTEILLNDAKVLYNNFKDVNGTLLMEYSTQMMTDLNKIAHAIP